MKIQFLKQHALACALVDMKKYNCVKRVKFTFLLEFGYTLNAGIENTNPVSLAYRILCSE